MQLRTGLSTAAAVDVLTFGPPTGLNGRPTADEWTTGKLSAEDDKRSEWPNLLWNNECVQGCVDLAAGEAHSDDNLPAAVDTHTKHSR